MFFFFYFQYIHTYISFLITVLQVVAALYSYIFCSLLLLPWTTKLLHHKTNCTTRTIVQRNVCTVGGGGYRLPLRRPGDGVESKRQPKWKAIRTAVNGSVSNGEWWSAEAKTKSSHLIRTRCDVGRCWLSSECKQGIISLVNQFFKWILRKKKRTFSNNWGKRCYSFAYQNKWFSEFVARRTES